MIRNHPHSITFPTSRSTARHRPASGSILIAVLVCAAVTTMILAGVASAALRDRRQVRQELQLEQTRWLLEAGLVHAARKTRDDDDYQGETIMLSPDPNTQREMIVTIAVTDAGDGAKQLDVTARIQSRLHASQPTQRTSRITIEVKN